MAAIKTRPKPRTVDDCDKVIAGLWKLRKRAVARGDFGRCFELSVKIDRYLDARNRIARRAA